MPCNCMTLAQTNAAASYIRCLRRSLGVPDAPKWDEAAHEALYRVAAQQVEILSESGLTAEQLRATPYGFQPERTANLAIRYGGWVPASDSLWACLGVSKAEADAQLAAGSGGYWTMLASAAAHVQGSEGGSGEKGMPSLLWVLLIAAGVGGLWLVLKD